MRVAFDTSVLVPALVAAHPRHERANAWLVAGVDGPLEGTMTWHGFAECWSVLTRLPLGRPLTGSRAYSVLQRCTRRQRRRTASRSSDAPASDSGLARCLMRFTSQAPKRAATYNVRDFQRLAASGSPAIVTPDAELPTG